MLTLVSFDGLSAACSFFVEFGCESDLMSHSL